MRYVSEGSGLNDLNRLVRETQYNILCCHKSVSICFFFTVVPKVLTLLRTDSLQVGLVLLLHPFVNSSFALLLSDSSFYIFYCNTFYLSFTSFSSLLSFCS